MPCARLCRASPLAWSSACTSPATSRCSLASCSACFSASCTSRSARPDCVCSRRRCASRSRSSAAAACAPPSVTRWPPPAASRWRPPANRCTASCRFCRCCSRVSCSSRRAASSSSCASCRCASPPPEAAAARLRRQTPLPLGFLLLPPRQLLQLLEQRVDLLIARSAVRRAAASRTDSPACRARARTDPRARWPSGFRRRLRRRPRRRCSGDLHLVLLLGFLQKLQRALLGRQRLLRRCPFSSDSAVFISDAAFGSASAIVLNDGSTTSSRLFIFSLSSSTCSRSRAWASVRKTTVLAELVGRHLGPVADEVERRRHDLALLLRELPDLLAGPAAHARPGLRLRRSKVRAERPDLDEVDIARRRLAGPARRRCRWPSRSTTRSHPACSPSSSR